MNNLNAAILNTFPSVDEAALDTLLSAELARDHTKLVVLDDDPTGVQTVHDVSVYTDWSAESSLSSDASSTPGKVFRIDAFR